MIARGFASLTREARTEIARRGGVASGRARAARACAKSAAGRTLLLPFAIGVLMHVPARLVLVDSPASSREPYGFRDADDPKSGVLYVERDHLAAVLESGSEIVGEDAEPRKAEPPSSVGREDAAPDTLRSQ